MKKPYVSIIVPTLNEERHISKCLESLVSLKYPKDRYEIIVVDNGSTDATLSLCGMYATSIHVFPGVNVSEIRNLGTRNAKGEIFAFIDGDCVADACWLENAVRSIALEPCVTGAYCGIPAESTWVERAWSARAPRGRREVAHIGTANLIVPATVFRQLGGFDPRLRTGEDYEFCTRAKQITKVVLDDSIRVVHCGNPKTLRDFVKREMWHGLGALGSLRTQVVDKPLIGTIGFLICTILQIASIVLLFLGGSADLFLFASFGIVLLLVLTVYNKRNTISGVKDAFFLFVLFYFYYLSRSVSLVMLLIGMDYHRKK
jgi:glycosyltransferase involved in cell wall biosynthesis